MSASVAPGRLAPTVPGLVPGPVPVDGIGDGDGSHGLGADDGSPGGGGSREVGSRDRPPLQPTAEPELSRRERRAARRAQHRLVAWSVLVVVAVLLTAILLVQAARGRPARARPAGVTVPAVHRIVGGSGP